MFIKQTSVKVRREMSQRGVAARNAVYQCSGYFSNPEDLKEIYAEVEIYETDLVLGAF